MSSIWRIKAFHLPDQLQNPRAFFCRRYLEQDGDIKNPLVCERDVSY